jgi:hypothetical protein
MAFEDHVIAILLLESVEKAKRVTARYALVEFAHENSSVVWVNKLANEFSDYLLWFVSCYTPA